MGAKLFKTGRAVPISEQNKELNTISTYRINETATLQRKIKNPKEKHSNKRSPNTRLDKCTNTNTGVISSSLYIKRTVGGPKCNKRSNTATVNSTHQSKILSKDILEFRDACIRRGIISPEINAFVLPISNEQDHQTNIVNKSTDETLTTVDVNKERIENKQTE